MKLQIRRRTLISAMISMIIALLLACTVQPETPSSSSEITSAEPVDSQASVEASVNSTMEAKNNELAIEATVQSSTSATSIVKETDDFDRTHLHNAAWNNSLDVARRLIEQGADIEANDQSDDRPLHLAAWNNSLDVARLLIDRGADIETKNSFDNTPLHLAASNNSLDVARLLIDSGADIEAQNKGEGTPLHLAALNNSLDVATLLIDLGADIEAKDKNDRTPLHLAAFNNSLDVATLLIDLGADIDAQKRDKNNQPDDTPLHGAVLGEALEVARLLIDRGADIEGKNSFDDTPLHLAAFNNSLDFATLLIERGADIEAKNKGDGTPRSLAAERNSLEVATLLIEQGANTEGIDLSWMPGGSVQPSLIYSLEICNASVSQLVAKNYPSCNQITSPTKSVTHAYFEAYAQPSLGEYNYSAEIIGTKTTQLSVSQTNDSTLQFASKFPTYGKATTFGSVGSYTLNLYRDGTLVASKSFIVQPFTWDDDWLSFNELTTSVYDQLLLNGNDFINQFYRISGEVTRPLGYAALYPGQYRRYYVGAVQDYNDCANGIENGAFCSTPGVFPIRNQYELIKNYQLMVVYADAEKFPKLSVSNGIDILVRFTGISELDEGGLLSNRPTFAIYEMRQTY